LIIAALAASIGFLGNFFLAEETIAEPDGLESRGRRDGPELPDLYPEQQRQAMSRQ
jgi:hypothetical protein